jgi:hypothetical protein
MERYGHEDFVEDEDKNSARSDMEICEVNEDDSPIFHMPAYFLIQKSEIIGDKALTKKKSPHKNMEFIIKLS